jgi:hypothetical protein
MAATPLGYGGRRKELDAIMAEMTTSSTSNSDDYPVQVVYSIMQEVNLTPLYPLQEVNLGFEFPFFQQRTSKVWLNPNGIVQLTNVLACGGPFMGGGCSIYNSYFNFVGAIFADFEPKKRTESVIGYWRQKANGKASTQAQSNRMDVVFSNLYLYGAADYNHYTLYLTILYRCGRLQPLYTIPHYTL